ncbi:cytochrome P450 86B1-like [Amaranthus tricolor]|uniref:cytochrome P450 86B1-like n=1 Tax=Amaranthus tricolor TaxID=29722 RepID=UPI00258EFDDA|nr:cytochrome P450 86B1-like [Amaranthus tricolor]
MNSTTSINELMGSTHTFSTQNFPISKIKTLEIFLALSTFITIHSIRQRKHQGLPTWPLLGMLPSLILGLRHNPYEWFTDLLRRRNGTFIFKGPWLSNLHCVLTANPSNIEYLLKTNFLNFPKGDYYKQNMEELLGNGIFAADYETWQQHRKILSMEFHTPRFQELTVQSLLQLVHSRLIPIMEDSIKKSTVIDLQDILLRLTFDNVCMVALGADPGCLSSPLPDILFARAFEHTTETILFRFCTPTCVWKLMRYFNLGPERALKTSIKKVNEFVDEIIRIRKNEKLKERSDLLAVLMKLRDDEKFLRDVCVNIIIAGRDTSSVAISWFFWLLDQHLDVEKKILDEIHRIISERGDFKEDDRDCVVFQPEEIKKMEYLHAAISEALRLYPSVPIDHKEVVGEDMFPDGTILKKGTKVLYSIYSMGRMESIWGMDCREYKPERWLKNGHFMNKSAFKFTAFNGGPRLCLGKQFSYYQMKFVAASLIFRYRVQVVQNQLVQPRLALTLYIKHGLKVKLTRRS